MGGEHDGGHLLEALGKIFPALASGSRLTSSWHLAALPGDCESSWSEHDMKQQQEDRNCIPVPTQSPPNTSNDTCRDWPALVSGDCHALSEGLDCRFLLTSVSDCCAPCFSLLPFLHLGCEIQPVLCGAVSCRVGNSLFLFVLVVLQSPAMA